MSTPTGCNQYKHAPGCGHPGATGGPAEVAVDLAAPGIPTLRTVEVPAENLWVGMEVIDDGEIRVVTSTDADHKSVSIEFDGDEDSIVSYPSDTAFAVVAQSGRECQRCGGPAGEDPTCHACTDSEGNPR